MISDFLKKYITSQAEYVEYGYGQVEPNHLSAQRTGQIYAQLPANKDINVLENGQFVKYDYAANENGIGEVNFTGKGEWMLVYNEIKLYREGQLDCEFAMVKDNYNARIYSPLDASTLNWDKQSRYYNGKDNEGKTSITMDIDAGDGNGTQPKTYNYDDLTAPADYYEPHYNEDPFHIESYTRPERMPAGTTMVPRVFKTNVGDIFTTNTIGETEVAIGDILAPRAKDGILAKVDGDVATGMQWQVVKIYTMPDRQKGVKIMRIA